MRRSLSNHPITPLWALIYFAWLGCLAMFFTNMFEAFMRYVLGWVLFS